MANFSSLFFLALLGLGAFGSSSATPYIPRQGSNHIQVAEPTQQQDEIILAAPLEQHQVAAPVAQPQQSSDLQLSPPRVNTDVEPIDQEVDSTEVLVQTLTEAERTNLVSYLICEMCKELQVSMCIRMCNGEASNGTQIEAGGNSTESNGQAGEEDGSLDDIFGEGEEGNSTAAANSTQADGSFGGGNGTDAEGSQEDDSVFNNGGDAATSGESSNSSVSAADGNSTSESQVPEEFGQSSSNSSMVAEEQSGNSTTQSLDGAEEDGSVFNNGGDAASEESNNSTLSAEEQGSSTVSSEFQGGNSTEEATPQEESGASSNN